MTPRHRILKTMISVLAALTILPGSARASGEIICDATDGSGASIAIGIGRLPVLHVLNAYASDGTGEWMIDPQGGETAMVFGQGYIDDSQVLIDFTDPNVERIIVSLRLFQSSTEKGSAEAGVLSFTDGGVFPVQCENG